MEFPTPRKLKITTLFLGADQWATARRLGKIRGLGKRGGAIIVREAIDQYLDRVSKPAEAPARRTRAR
jgi:hypothetical protein